MSIRVLKKGSPPWRGPYTEGEVRALMDEGSLLPTDYYWLPGMATWAPLFERFGEKASTAPAAGLIKIETAEPSSWAVLAKVTTGAALILLCFGSLKLLVSLDGSPDSTSGTVALPVPPGHEEVPPSEPYVESGDDSPEIQEDGSPADFSEPDELADLDDRALA